MERQDPDHPIVDRPWEYDIVRCCYDNAPEGGSIPFLDLNLRRGDVVRRLRFLDPQDLQIARGFPTRSAGLAIFDVRTRQLDRLGILVCDKLDTITFLARDVIDLDAEGPA